MTSKYENIYEILSVPLALYSAYDKAKADGKIDASDIQYLVGPLLKLPSAIDQANLSIKELQTLTGDDRSKLMQRLSAEFDIGDDALEAKIEAAVSWILSTGELVGAFTNHG